VEGQIVTGEVGDAAPLAGTYPRVEAEARYGEEVEDGQAVGEGIEEGGEGWGALAGVFKVEVVAGLVAFAYFVEGVGEGGEGVHLLAERVLGRGRGEARKPNLHA